MHIRSLTTAPEKQAERIVRRTLERTAWDLAPMAQIQRVLEKDEGLSEAEFSLYTRGHFDFAVYGPDGKAVFVVEFDGFGHENPRQIARDLIKNQFCAMAHLPLLRIGANELRERDEVSVLEWLVGAFVAFDRELDDLEDEDDEDEVDLEDAVSVDEGDVAGEGTSEDPEEEPALGEDGFTFESEHPFPDNAFAAGRLLERFGISVGREVANFAASEETAPYLLKVSWPGRQPPRFRDSQVSQFVISERDFWLFDRNRPTEPLFTSVARADFACAHRMPRRANAPEPGTAPMDFPWDPWGVASELALYDALCQVSRWAAGGLKRRPS